MCQGWLGWGGHRACSPHFGAAPSWAERLHGCWLCGSDGKGLDAEGTLRWPLWPQEGAWLRRPWAAGAYSGRGYREPHHHPGHHFPGRVTCAQRPTCRLDGVGGAPCAHALETPASLGHPLPPLLIPTLSEQGAMSQPCLVWLESCVLTAPSDPAWDQVMAGACSGCRAPLRW